MIDDIPNLNKPNIVFDFKPKILVKHNVIDESICDELIEYGKNHVCKGVNKYPWQFQIQFDACVLPLNHTIHTILQDTWKEAIDFFKFDIDFVEPYELKRYSVDDFFGRHVDNYENLTNTIDRKITMSIQLSNADEYSGGQFVFLNKSYRLNKGSIICFPSFFPH